METETRVETKFSGGRDLAGVAAVRPSTTYDNDDLPQISKILTEILDKAGFSEDHRASVANYGVMRQMLHTITDLMKSKGFNCTLRMGSSIEGTTALGMGSDADVVYFPTSFQAYSNLMKTEGNSGFVLIHDESTHAGYAKLQPAYDGTFITDASDTRLKEGMDPNFKFQTDRHGRLVMLHLPASPRADKRHGPADTTEGRVHQLDKDFVPSITSDDITNEMEEWYYRKRKYDWPSKETRDLYKKLGLFLVCAGHPSSLEPQLEWRMSFSLQERHIMRHLNPTQYHSFMLLKLIKKYLIKPRFGDVLTSYHCKTVLFYTMEENEQAIWIPENLILCLRMCLSLLKKWVSDRYIPNYFIPGENMFVKMETALKEKYDDFKRFVTDMYCDWQFLFQIGFNNIGQGFLFKLNGYQVQWNGEEYRMNLPLSNDVPVYGPRRKRCNSDAEFCTNMIKQGLNFTDDVLDVLRLSHTCVRYKTFEETIAKLCMSYNDSSFERFPQLLESFQFAVEDNEREPRTFAIKAAQSGLRINLASALAAQHFQEENLRCLEEIYEYLELSKSFDPITGRLIKATVLLKQKRYSDTNAELHAAETACKDRKFNCQCYKQHKIYQGVPGTNQTHQTWFGCTFEDPYDVSGLVCTGCLCFKRFELNLLPIPLTFESYRAILSPTNSRSTFENAWVDSVAVDPVMYMYYLQLLNNEHCNPSRAYWALQQMESTLFKRLGTGDASVERQHLMYAIDSVHRGWNTPGHFDTWLNILGDIFAKKGWTRLALRCFKYSYKLRPLDNAVGWHVMFLLFSSPDGAK